MSAGPESSDDYFQKGVLLGQKAALNLRHKKIKFSYIFYSHNSIVSSKS